MTNRITGSKKNEYGEVGVYFANENTPDAYYTHGTTSIGSETDSAGKFDTAWSWVNHLRYKRWWNPQLEYDFFKEVAKHL